MPLHGEPLQVLLDVLGALGVATDGMNDFACMDALEQRTSELNEAHRALKTAHDTLEATVASRTADLVAANQEVQRLAYIVSHDLRSPLVNIMGFANELRVAREEMSRMLETVAPEARQALGSGSAAPGAISGRRTTTWSRVSGASLFPRELAHPSSSRLHNMPSDRRPRYLRGRIFTGSRRLPRGPGTQVPGGATGTRSPAAMGCTPPKTMVRGG